MGLDINFFKAKRANYEAYNEAHEKWAEEKPACANMSHAEYEKLSDAEKEKIQKQVNDWYEKEPLMEKHGINDAGYFRKVNFLMTFFSYTGNCEFQEICKAVLEDLKAITDKLSAIKPLRKVKRFYKKNEKLVKALASLTDEEKANLDIPVFLTGLGFDFSDSKTDQRIAKFKERSIHDVKVILGIEKPVEGEDYWVENIYRKADKKLAEVLLPTTSGFFFGSTDYDHGYWQDVKEVNEWVTNLLADLADDEMVLMYCWW